MNKKGWGLILLVTLIAVNVFAVDYPEPTSWVNDYAGVLGSGQKQELDSLLKDFETATTNQIFVCIMETLPADTSLEEYVNELFERWQPGQKDKDNGVLLAIFINDRKLRIEVGYGLEEKLTDAVSKLIITNEIAPGFKQGDYYRGIKNGITSIIQTTKGTYTPGTNTKQRTFWFKIKSIIGQRCYDIVYVFGEVFRWYLQHWGIDNFSDPIDCAKTVPAVFCFLGFLWFMIFSLKHAKRSSGSSTDTWTIDSGRSSSSRSRRSSRSRSSGFSGGGGGSSGGGGASGSW